MHFIEVIRLYVYAYFYCRTISGRRLRKVIGEGGKEEGEESGEVGRRFRKKRRMLKGRRKIRERIIWYSLRRTIVE